MALSMSRAYLGQETLPFSAGTVFIRVRDKLKTHLIRVEVFCVDPSCFKVLHFKFSKKKTMVSTCATLKVSSALFAILRN
jgi:hypothetical protein